MARPAARRYVAGGRDGVTSMPAQASVSFRCEVAIATIERKRAYDAPHAGYRFTDVVVRGR
jgi:hypothetical protein